MPQFRNLKSIGKRSGRLRTVRARHNCTGGCRQDREHSLGPGEKLIYSCSSVAIEVYFRLPGDFIEVCVCTMLGRQQLAVVCLAPISEDGLHLPKAYCGRARTSRHPSWTFRWEPEKSNSHRRPPELICALGIRSRHFCLRKASPMRSVAAMESACHFTAGSQTASKSHEGERVAGGTAPAAVSPATSSDS